jgi:putative endopeptidase
VVDSLFAQRDLQPVRSYLAAFVLHANASYLGAGFAQEGLRGRHAFTGESTLQPRWQRCMRATQASVGQPLGKVYVERFFNQSDRHAVEALVQTLLAELKLRLAASSWMSEPTRASALRKAAVLRARIGYGEPWPAWEGLKVQVQPFALNVLDAARYTKTKEFRAAGGPADRAAWPDRVPASMVNAGFDEAANDLIFPAGVLQPPFFDRSADLASNYGGIGVAIGHEIMHAFDDAGRMRDETGRVGNWWSPDDARKFEARAAGLAAQFDARVVLDGVHVDGRLTLGENIAELGGAQLAYGALARALGDRLRVPDGTGYTPEQRFFIAYAQVYREKETPQALRTRVATNEHAPGWTRVLGVVQNMPEFARAFRCLPGDPMVLAAPVRFLDPE